MEGGMDKRQEQPMWKDWRLWLITVAISIFANLVAIHLNGWLKEVNLKLTGVATRIPSVLFFAVVLLVYYYILRRVWTWRSGQAKAVDPQTLALKQELWLVMRRLEPLFDFSFSHSFITVFSQANMDFEKDSIFALANWFAFFRTQFQRSHDLQSGTGVFLSLVVRQAEGIYQSFHKRYQGGTTKEQKDLVRDYNSIIGDLKAWLKKASDSFEVPVHKINYIEEPNNL